MVTIPQQYRPKALFTVLRKFRERVYAFLDAHKPYLNRMRYCGFWLYYTVNEGLVNRIRFMNPDRIYERDLSEALARELSWAEQPVFVDVGANIGLVSLYVAAHVPRSLTYAFEPGPHQYNVFRITIFANKLEDKIRLSDIALSNTSGHQEFAVHTFKPNSAGDGFVDTGRGGATKTIRVRTETMDEWWERESRPRISVVKIDTEGAELWILQGATQLLRTVKPVIFLEIALANIKAYPYTHNDIYAFLEQQGYLLFTLEGVRCTRENFEALVQVHDTFIARPA